MSALIFTSKLANRQIAGKEYTIERHDVYATRGVVVLTNEQKAVFPVEECGWCGCWVPTIGRMRSQEGARTAKWQDVMLPDGTKTREMVPGSDKMVCFSCYESQRKKIQKPEVIPARRKVPYAKISEI